LTDSPLLEYCARIELAPPPARTTSQRAFETFANPLPDMARRLHSPVLAQKLDTLLSQNQYDVVQIEGIEMAAVWLNSKSKTSNQKSAIKNPKSIFDDHNAEWTLQKTAYETDRANAKRLHGALYSFIQFNKLKAFEREVCLAADAVAVVSQPDADAIGSLDPRIKPVVIPNGVDCDLYVPSEGVCAKPLAELSVVFTGKMDFRPNIDACIWFASEILPLLRKETPLAHVSFVGQKPAPQVLALENLPGVTVTGFVPDTRPYIADAAVFAVPLRMGSGTRLKVLEAMAMGKAIVSTTFGVSGIEYTNGHDVLVADDPREFAQTLAQLMRDPARARALGANARRLAESKYDWRIVVPKFESLYH
jgi:glycosyltransferase involved in cell wall biosynthesis